jgi:hypothetical protein
MIVFELLLVFSAPPADVTSGRGNKRSELLQFSTRVFLEVIYRFLEMLLDIIQTLLNSQDAIKRLQTFLVTPHQLTTLLLVLAISQTRLNILAV